MGSTRIVVLIKFLTLPSSQLYLASDAQNHQNLQPLMQGLVFVNKNCSYFCVLGLSYTLILLIFHVKKRKSWVTNASL